MTAGDAGFIVDSARAWCLCTAGRNDHEFVAAVVVEADGSSHLAIVERASIGDQDVRYVPSCPAAVHENVGALPLEFVKRIVVSRRSGPNGQRTATSIAGLFVELSAAPRLSNASAERNHAPMAPDTTDGYEKARIAAYRLVLAGLEQDPERREERLVAEAKSLVEAGAEEIGGVLMLILRYFVNALENGYGSPSAATEAIAVELAETLLRSEGEKP